MPQKKKNPQRNPKEAAAAAAPGKDPGYLISMSEAPPSRADMAWLQLVPLIFFTAAVIFITRYVSFRMDLNRFYWTAGLEHVDFFSFAKMIAILICASAALLFLLYRVFAQTFAVKRSSVYIPMLVYAAFVGLSFAFSQQKDYALLGFAERFEGTLVLLSYMIMLFYAINTVNGVRSVKLVLYALAASGALLGALGVSQAIGRDFFGTRIGGLMILPYDDWNLLDRLTFNFREGQIYQTVYNINYVSFYLTLILPVIGLLFIHAFNSGRGGKLAAKVIWAALFSLILFNLIGSESSGGFLGMGVVVIGALVILGKRVLAWWRPLAVLVALTLVIGAVTLDRWMPELSSAIRGAAAVDQAAAAVQDVPAQTGEGVDEPEAEAPRGKSRIDFMEVNEELFMLDMSVNGEPLTIRLDPESGFSFDIFDGDGRAVGFKPHDIEKNEFALDDERFEMCVLTGARNEEDNLFMLLRTDDQEWVFLVDDLGMRHVNGLGKLTELRQVRSWGFANKQNFGSGRGYIWSRTFPMMKDSILLGRGADTYCIYFPQNDYVGKYNAGWALGTIVDKPHNMYMGMAVGTGGVSLAAFLTLLGLYFVQSARLCRRLDYSEFLDFAGLGLFLGILGFAVSGLVNDSSVSVMPMFYGLLGTGIAVNIMLERNLKA